MKPSYKFLKPGTKITRSTDIDDALKYFKKKKKRARSKEERAKLDICIKEFAKLKEQL